MVSEPNVSMAKLLDFIGRSGQGWALEVANEKVKIDQNNVDSRERPYKVYAQLTLALVEFLKANDLKLGGGEHLNFEEPIKIEGDLGNARASKGLSYAWYQYVWSFGKVAVVLLGTARILGVGWCCQGVFVKEMERVEMRGRQLRVETRTSMNYGLCHTLGSVRVWDAETCKNIFRDVEISVPYFSYILQVLWNIFDEKSVVGKLIIKKLEVEINKVTFSKGLPT